MIYRANIKKGEKNLDNAKLDLMHLIPDSEVAVNLTNRLDFLFCRNNRFRIMKAVTHPTCKSKFKKFSF